jgi:hypothetical protein
MTTPESTLDLKRREQDLYDEIERLWEDVGNHMHLLAQAGEWQHYDEYARHQRYVARMLEHCTSAVLVPPVLSDSTPCD